MMTDAIATSAPTIQEKRRQETVQLIQAIVEHLNVHDQASGDLWKVLTALRGPDNNDILLKNRTTAKLRRAVGIIQTSFAMVSDYNPPIEHRDSLMVTDELRQRGIPYDWHFTNHYSWGVEALVNLGLLQSKDSHD